MGQGEGGFALAKKAVNVRGDAGKLMAPFKGALGVQDAAWELEMCVTHAAAISTCMMDLDFMEDVQRKKNIVPTFTAYYNGCTLERVKEMLNNVGFTLDGKAKPDHTVSTLTGKCCIKLALVRVMLQRSPKTVTQMLLLRKRSLSGSQDASTPYAVRPPAWLSGRGWRQHGSCSVCVTGGTGQQSCCESATHVPVVPRGVTDEAVVQLITVITIITTTTTITITTITTITTPTIIATITINRKKENNNINSNRYVKLKCKIIVTLS